MLKTCVIAQSKLADVKERLGRLRKDESGAALIEYSLLIGLIVVGAVVAMAAVGGKVGDAWTGLNTAMD